MFAAWTTAENVGQLWQGANGRGALLWASLPLIGVLLLAALVIYYVDRWRKRGEAGTSENPADQLSSFRSLYETGQLSREEFDRIRSRLGEKMRQELGVSSQPAAPIPESPTTESKEPPVTGPPPA